MTNSLFSTAHPTLDTPRVMCCSISMFVPFLSAFGVVRDAKCTGAGTGANYPLADGVQLLSANAVLLSCQGVMASPGLVPGLFLRGVHGCKVGGDGSVISVFKGMP